MSLLVLQLGLVPLSAASGLESSLMLHSPRIVATTGHVLSTFFVPATPLSFFDLMHWNRPMVCGSSSSRRILMVQETQIQPSVPLFLETCSYKLHFLDASSYLAQWIQSLHPRR